MYRSLRTMPLPESIDAVVAHDRVRAARHHIERSDESTLARQAALSAIPAPTGAEGARGAHLAALFRDAGLSDVAVDEVGNVTGWMGTHREDAVVLSAHLDTVFAAGLDVSVARSGARLEGPGISDNARGLAALVTVAEALVQSRVPTVRPVAPPTAAPAATPGPPSASRTRPAPWAERPRYSPTCPRTTHHARLVQLSALGEVPASIRFRRRRGSTSISGARTRGP